jgi:putative selenate reductase molybdopterin-binding subunit
LSARDPGNSVQYMNIEFNVNGKEHALQVRPGENLLVALRKLGYFSVKHGCETGECGACAVQMNDRIVNSCVYLAAQADGCKIETVEGLGENPDPGWRESHGLHPLQTAFVESGAIQCGYCTPAMLTVAAELLNRNPTPTEAQVRDVLSGVLCRCTGYVKPVQAILRAARVLRGEIEQGETITPDDLSWILGPTPMPHDPEAGIGPGAPAQTAVRVMPQVVVTPQTERWRRVGKPEIKVDAHRLVQGKPVFAGDMEKRDVLIGRLLKSPVAHARIKRIDASRARSLPGVVAVLTHEDIPRIPYATPGQAEPLPAPLDMFSLPKKVRFVGDRVAFIAAETAAIAEKALELIEVEYEPLPAIIDPAEALRPGATIIHDEPDYVPFADSDPTRNLAAQIRIDIGEVEKGFSEADQIFEQEYETPRVQQAHIEPHTTLTYWDHDDRLVIVSSTQVPFHVRRILSPVLGLPVRRIRVVKPRIGGGFGGKQDVVMEDIPAHLTIATGRPVMFEYTREDVFLASRSRHPMRFRLKTGVRKDGTITANEMYCLSDTGAYGTHALPVAGNTGHKSMALYVGDGPYRKNPNIRFYADIVYTNTPISGAFRGYGVPQGFWAVERHMDHIARQLGLDPIEFRLKNAVRAGELQPFSTAWSEGREPTPETLRTVGLEECVRQGRAAAGWDEKYRDPGWRTVPGAPHLRRGIGVAFAMQGTAIPYIDMGGASLKLNEDGSFNLLIGATDLGTGSDTVLAQMAAEVLGVRTDDIIVHSSDTDFTPYDVGAYASSTTYISGAAVVRAAQLVADKICTRAARMLNEAGDGVEVHAGEIDLVDRKAVAPDGRVISLAAIARHAFHIADQEQIMAVGSYHSPVAPPPFVAQFAEVTVDIETGNVKVDRLVIAQDSGVIVNPLTASGQVEGAMTQALGYGVCEEQAFDREGRPRERNFRDYHIFRAHEMPELVTIFVETFEPSHPFGVKAVGEVPIDAAAPAIANAIQDASGADVNNNPVTPEKIWRAIHRSGSA